MVKKKFRVWYVYKESPFKEQKTTRMGYTANEVQVDMLNLYGHMINLVRTEEVAPVYVEASGPLKLSKLAAGSSFDDGVWFE